MTVQRRACVLSFKVQDSSVDVVLTARDDAAPALVRSASFNIHYRNVAGQATDALAQLVREAAKSVVSRDQGHFRLDGRKGLVGPEAVRRAKHQKN
ncbi:MAG: hypothetical protein R3B07_17400 [Polyangiaceae bacterium]